MTVKTLNILKPMCIFGGGGFHDKTNSDSNVIISRLLIDHRRNFIISPTWLTFVQLTSNLEFSFIFFSLSSYREERHDLLFYQVSVLGVD